MRLLLLAAAGLLLMVAAGCTSAFVRHAQPQSLPVLTGAATTNDVQAVAWLELARATNRAVNPTPTQIPVDEILGAGIALASALAGWLGRHHSPGPSPPQGLTARAV